jgi:single-strand DNA-binding protein
VASFNSVTILGNCTRDAAVKFLPSQTAVAEWGMAVNRKFRTAAGEDREDVLFIDVEAFGKLGEVCGKFLEKGKPCLVSGRLRMDVWDDKQTGGKRSKISIVAETVQFLGSKSDAEQAHPRDDGSQTQQRQPPRFRDRQPAGRGGYDRRKDDELERQRTPTTDDAPF